MLRSVVLTLHHDACGQMGNTHSRICPVHVLPTRPARSIGIDPKIRGGNFDVYAVIDLRVGKYRGKRYVDGFQNRMEIF